MNLTTDHVVLGTSVTIYNNNLVPFNFERTFPELTDSCRPKEVTCDSRDPGNTESGPCRVPVLLYTTFLPAYLFPQPPRPVVLFETLLHRGPLRGCVLPFTALDSTSVPPETDPGAGGPEARPRTPLPRTPLLPTFLWLDRSRMVCSTCRYRGQDPVLPDPGPLSTVTPLLPTLSRTSPGAPAVTLGKEEDAGPADTSDRKTTATLFLVGARCLCRWSPLCSQPLFS